MPFIDSKVTLPMTEDKKETIKAKLGQAITIIKQIRRVFNGRI